LVYGARARFRMAVWERAISRGGHGDRARDVKHIDVSHSSCWWFHLFTLMAWDGGAWAVALIAGVALRYELDFSQLHILGLEQLIAVVLLAQLATGTALQVYSGRHCIGSVDDAINVSVATTLVGVIAFGFNLLQPTLIPR